MVINLSRKKKITGKGFLKSLKSKVEEVRILPGVKSKVPIGVKVAAASLLIPGAGGLALKGTKSLGKSLAPKTLGGALKTAVLAPTAIGVLSSSKKARDVVKKAINPKSNIERGKNIAKIIEGGEAEDVLGLKGKTSLKEKAKSALAVGGTAGLVLGAAALAKKALKKKRDKTPTLGTLDEAIPAQVGVSSLQAPRINENQQTSPLPTRSNQEPIKNMARPLTIVQVKI